MLEAAVEDAGATDIEPARRMEADLLCAARLDQRTLPVVRRRFARRKRDSSGTRPET